MKIVILYLHVAGKVDPNAPNPEYYTQFHKRFTATYMEFIPPIEHGLHICCCGAYSPKDMEGRLVARVSEIHRYYGAGWDIGAFQHCANSINADLLVCLSTPVYFHRADWLEKIVAAVEKHGDGLYGTMASYEHSPHIRTSCFAVNPRHLREYPNVINTRERARFFESTDWNFSAWMERSHPVILVLPDGTYQRTDWRKYPNIFRRGDQSNVLVRDRHWDIYHVAGLEERAALEKAAEGRQ
jgi:hypothetical protein